MPQELNKSNITQTDSRILICRGKDDLIKSEISANFHKLTIQPPKSFSFHFSIGIASIILASLQDPNQQVQVIYGKDRDVPVGYAHIILNPQTRNAEIKLIETFKKRDGYGSLLLTNIKELDVDQLNATVYKKPNPELFPLKIDFYKKNGFIPSKIKPNSITFTWNRRQEESLTT